MAQVTISQLTGSQMRPNVLQDGLSVDQTVTNTPFLDFLDRRGRVSQNRGAQPLKLVIETAGLTAEAHTEGDNSFTFNSTAYAQASFNAFYRRVPVGQSGHVRDNNDKGGYYQDVIKRDLARANMDLRKKLEVELLGSTADIGISALVDSTNTVGGLSPSTYTAWASAETDVSGALTIAVLEDNCETMRTSTYGAVMDFILVTPNMTTNYLRTIGPGASSGGTFRILNNDTAGFDAGLLKAQPSWQGMEWVETMDFTTTELIMGDSSKYELVVHRDPAPVVLGKTNDDEKVLVIGAWIPALTRRKSFIKLFGITA